MILGLRIRIFNCVVVAALLGDGSLLSTRASAQTKQQLNSCVNKGHDYSVDQQIAGCTAAIDSGRQTKHNLAISFNNRGSAYFENADNDRAIADFNRSIQINPGAALTYFNRGVAYLYAGAVPKALADLNRASALDPKDAFTALWLDIISKRSNLAGRLAEATRQVDMTKWPAPIIRFYLGQMTPEAVLAAADNPDATTKIDQVCGVNFYSAELALQRGAKDEAARLFGLAVAGCRRGWNEWAAANAELKALGASP